MLDGLREELATIRKFQLDIIWRNYVHEAFRERKTEVEKRRRDLLLVLSDQDLPVKMAKITQLNPSTARAYAGKTRMVLNRDLNALRRMGLIQRGAQGCQARKEIIEAFLPFRMEPPKSLAGADSATG
jgi:hypothetical protein